MTTSQKGRSPPKTQQISARHDGEKKNCLSPSIQSPAHEKSSVDRKEVRECEGPEPPPPMATLTRSSRRADALHPRSSSNVSNARLIATSTRGGAVHPQTILKSPPMMPRAHKRPLEVSDHEYEAIRKKTRITVEIISRSTIPIPKPPTAAAVNLVAPSPQLQHQKPTGAAPKSAPHTAAPTVKTEEATATTASHEHGPSDAPSGLTKHQKKVINGIRHELDRLQPNADDTRREGRKLRSQEGTRFKSELSAYFPEYDEIIGNEPKEHRTSIALPSFCFSRIFDEPNTD